MAMVRLFTLAPLRIVGSIALLGIVSGAFSAVILALINHVMYETGDAVTLLLGVMGVLIIGKIYSSVLSRWLLIRYAQDMLLDLSVDLCRQVLAAPLILVERTGQHRLLTALTTDVPTLGATLQALPTLTVNSAVISGCVAYLGWLYPMGLLALGLAAAAGTGIYWALHASAFAAIRGARQRRDDVMKSFRELADGLKELKMNSARAHEFVEINLDSAARELKNQNLKAMRKYLYLDAWSQGLFYFMLAGVLAFFPRNLTNSTEILTGFAFAALYMMAPVWAIIGALPTLTAGANSLQKLDEIGLAFRQANERTAAAVAPPVTSTVERVEMKDVVFSYEGDGAEFRLGPLDLTLSRGEVVFLIGGNGSGKTTLVKLLTGLYQPDLGEIRLDGSTIDAATAEWYRQHFSVVFFDFHLFDGLLGVAGDDVDEAANRYLHQLELDHKVEVKGRRFSSTELSQGQRKRLALLTALMEERPICVFDEWAADQDPRYKEVFYTRILPMLKARNKIVIVVSHDDRYFHHGDRVIKLDQGRISASERRFVKTA